MAQRQTSSRQRSRRQPTEEALGQPTAIVENHARPDCLMFPEH
jgi:hypothetical protein